MRARILISLTATLGVLGVVPTASPAAHDGTTCDYARTEAGPGSAPGQENVIVGTASGPEVVVYGPAPDLASVPNVKWSSEGMSGTAGTVVGACANTDTSDPNDFEGGTVEAGVGEDPATDAVNDPNDLPGGVDAYVVVDGDNDNIDPLDAYVGVSNWETATKSSCPPGTSGTGSNSGGCIGIDNQPLTTTAVPLLVCGNSSGNKWDSTTRDGCFIP